MILSVLLVLATSGTAMAETYRCANHEVLTDADAGVLLDSRPMRQIGAETFVAGPYVFRFVETYNHQHVVVTLAILSKGKQTVVCQ